MKTLKLGVTLALLSMGTMACGTLSQLSDGISNAANDGEWSISGSVNESANGASSVSKAVSSDGCVADQVIATDSQAETTTATVDENCAFTMTVPSGESYVVSFMLDGAFVGTLVFDSGIDGLTTSSLPLVTGSGDLELGTITMQGDLATPSQQPLDTIDRDADGVVDSEDPDDDGDNIPDDEELDCDYDGLVDDLDPDVAAVCDTRNFEEEGWVVAIKPHYGQEDVSVYRTIRALLSCRVDPDTVDPDTFRVYADDHEVQCEYDFGNWRRRPHRHRRNHREIERQVSPLHIVKCRHYDDPFDTDTLYTVSIDGLECLDGRLIEAADIDFVTRLERDEHDEEMCLEMDAYEDGVEPDDSEWGDEDDLELYGDEFDDDEEYDDEDYDEYDDEDDYDDEDLEDDELDDEDLEDEDFEDEDLEDEEFEDEELGEEELDDDDF